MSKVKKEVQTQRDNAEKTASNAQSYVKEFKKQNRIDDEVGAIINLKEYDDNTLNLEGFEMFFLYDDVVLVEYADEGQSGEITRGGIIIPTNQLNKNQKPWRIGKVLLVGPNCQYTKVDDYVQFPDDKGMKSGNFDVKGIGKTGKVVFLNESRLFGKVEKKK